MQGSVRDEAVALIRELVDGGSPWDELGTDWHRRACELLERAGVPFDTLGTNNDRWVDKVPP